MDQNPYTICVNVCVDGPRVFFGGNQEERTQTHIMAEEEEEETTAVYVQQRPVPLDLPAAVQSVEFRQQPIALCVSGEVCSDMAMEFDEAFQNAIASGQTEVIIYIHSDGGCVYSGLKMCDTILLAPEHVTVHTVCQGSCMSAAALIWTCGNTRTMQPNASLMIHSVATSLFEGKTGDIAVESKELSRLTETMCRVMSENTGVNIKFFKTKMEKNVDIYLSAHDAFEQKLCTHIGDVRMRATVSLTASPTFTAPRKKRKRARID